MPPFDGLTVAFDSDELTPLPALRQALLAVAPALQEHWPDAVLFKLDDWHEHDGYVNVEQPSSWQELWQRIGNNETTMSFTHGDWEVRLAFFPDDYGFYLRVYIPAASDQDYPERRGSFDLTCAPKLASALAARAAAASGLPMAETEAKTYFDRCYSG